MNKRTITSIITGILILLISITIITYAYFASQITNNAIVDIETGFDIGAISFIASGTDNLAMQLSHADLMQVQEDEVAKTVSSDVNISLLANSTNTVRCTYDIVWNWVETATPANRYTKTPGAIKEFTVFGSDGTNNISERQVPNYTGGNLSTIIYSGIITNNSTTIPTSQTWEMSANFYNLAILQDAVATGNYVSTITVENVDCVPLPVDFTQNYELLEYIQSTGTQYINTEFFPTNTTKMHFHYYSNNLANSWYISGARKTSSSTILFAQSGSTTNDTVLAIVNGTTQTANTNDVNWNRSVEGDSIYDVVLETKNGVFDYTINNESLSKKFIVTNVAYPLLGTTDVPIYIGAFNTSNILQNTSRWYEYQLWDNGVMVRNMIPAKRNLDNVVGMYDIVNNVFYTNMGTGTFLYG